MPLIAIDKAEFLRRLGPDGPEHVSLPDFARFGMGISLDAAYGRITRGTFPLRVIRSGRGDKQRMAVRADDARRYLAGEGGR